MGINPKTSGIYPKKYAKAIVLETVVPGSKGFGSFCPTPQEQDEKKPVWETQSGEDGPRQREDGGVGGAPRRMKGARRTKMLVRTR